LADGVALSIVIPSHDNRERLEATLASACRLEGDPACLEVVVEDDASGDGTYEALRGRSYPFRFSIARGEHRSQSAATNAAIGRARGEIVLCAASDLIFDPGLVRRHLECHRRFAGADVAVQGHLPYTPELNERPLMYYLMHGGPQFGFTAIRDPCRLAPNFCYAPNLSVSRAVLERVGGFDPFFRYGGQDTDLGYRLVAAGVRLIYEPEAVAWHDHPVSLEQYFTRQRAAGLATVLLAERHPGLEGGPRLWDAAIAAYLAYPGALLDRDLEAVRLLEPRVAACHPGYQRLWSAVVCEGTRAAADLRGEEARTFDLAQALFGAYDRLMRFHWGRAFVEESVRRHGAASVARAVGERLLKSQTTLTFRRTLARRLAAHGVALEAADEHDVLDTLIFVGLRDYREVWSALACLADPAAAVYNREVLLAVARDGFGPGERERVEDACEVVAAESVESALAQALGRARGELVVVRPGRPYVESEALRRAIRRAFGASDRLALIGASAEDPATGARVAGYRRDGTALACDPAGPAAGARPIEVPAAGSVWLRRRLAARIGADPGAFLAQSSRGWTHGLGAAAAGEGLACHVPALDDAPPPARLRQERPAALEPAGG